MYNGSSEAFKYICSTRDNANIDFSHNKKRKKNIITLENYELLYYQQNITYLLVYTILLHTK